MSQQRVALKFGTSSLPCEHVRPGYDTPGKTLRETSKKFGCAGGLSGKSARNISLKYFIPGQIWNSPSAPLRGCTLRQGRPGGCSGPVTPCVRLFVQILP